MTVCLKAWFSHSSTSPMQAFVYAVSSTKNNLIRWKRSTRFHIEKKIRNIEKEIAKLDDPSLSSNDPWKHIWLRALQNRHDALLL